MNKIYREKDVVYHYNYGQGVITDIIQGDFPIWVQFENSCEVHFRLNGSETNSEPPTLSFTPYDLINGGFSQERPKPEIEKGTVIYVKYNTSPYWHIGTFDDWNDKGNIGIAALDGITRYFPEYSLENPLK